MRGEILVIDTSPYGRVLVSESLTYCDDRVNARDVYCGGSFAGAEAVAITLRQGVKAVIAHDGGIGKDNAGISGLALAQQHGVPAAAVATMSARVSDGKSLYDGVLSHVNDAARQFGIAPGQAVHTAAWTLLQCPPGRPIAVPPSPQDELRVVVQGAGGNIVAIWRSSLVKGQHPHDVFMLGSHMSELVFRQVSAFMPRGVIANDVGRAKDDSGIAGLPLLATVGVAAAAVGTMTARAGDALSTYHDGIVSVVNTIAASAGVRVGMPAKEAAQTMLEREPERK
jgi:hypothetical protein